MHSINLPSDFNTNLLMLFSLGAFYRRRHLDRVVVLL